MCRKFLDVLNIEASGGLYRAPSPGAGGIVLQGLIISLLYLDLIPAKRKEIWKGASLVPRVDPRDLRR